MTEPSLPQRLQVTPGLRRMMDYRKFSGAAPRVLILGTRYWLDAACERAARRLGWDVALTPVVMEGTMPREQVASFLDGLATFRPDFVLTVNLGGMDEQGLFAGLLADLQVPFVTWFVDDPRTIIMDRSTYASPWAMALSWEPAYLDYLRSVGFEAVHALPLAADAGLFHGAPSMTASLPPAFVGSSMRGYATQEWARLREQPVLAAALEAAFVEGKVDRARFGEGMHSMLEGEAWAQADAEGRRQLELVCFIEGTRRLREQLMRRCAPLGVLARGDDGWRESGCLCGPPLDYEASLPRWYRDCPVNLNTTSIQMPSAVNQRVFDCPAAGGFLLTDAQSSIESLFDKGDLATYRSLEECVDKLRFFAMRPEARFKMVRKAQQRVRSEHTYEHRLRRLHQLLTERFGG